MTDTPIVKKHVVAFSYRMAQVFARSMGWVRSEWIFVGPHTYGEPLAGLAHAIIYELRTLRYHPTQVEKDRMHFIWSRRVMPMVNMGRAKLNVVSLP